MFVACNGCCTVITLFFAKCTLLLVMYERVYGTPERVRRTRLDGAEVYSTVSETSDADGA